MIFDSIRKLSNAIDSRSLIAKSIAIGSIRLLAILFALSASAAIETAPNWSESEPPIRFKSRDWADAALAAASTNSSIAIEGGRLLSNTTWDATKTHLVFNTVYVPSGITLTISAGAVVKFCPGTMIKVEDGGKLSIIGASGNDVILTAANDATVGEVVAGLDDVSIAFGGIRLQSSGATFTDNSHLETRGFNYGAFPTVSVLGTEAVRNGGVAYVPFTLSGSSRETAFSVEWEAVQGTAKFGDDYTLASGTISWAKSSEDTKTLQIPLNAENITGEERTFTVRIKAARCSNIGTRTATVKIVERDALTLEWAGDWAESEPPIRFKSRDWADAVLAAASTNDAISVEGGRLLTNTTWDATKTHLVFNTVYVPSGITLTISEGTVVKFCPGTMIKVEDGGKLSIVGASGNDVILTAANDATVGEIVEGLGEEAIAFGGIRLQSSAATFTDNGWLETRGFNYGAYPSVTLNDSTAFRSSGLASIPVTISGTRDQTLTIDWVAVDDTAKYEEDYTLAAGRITWGKASEGTKTITIPLVTTNIVGETTTFKIKIVTARGANIADGECTVSIREFDTLNIESASAESEPPIRFKSRDWADAVLAAASTNDAIAIEGGRLLTNTTWDATKTHLVFNTVYVPSGVTLTISAGAVVKFCSGTMIKVEDGGKLSIVGASGNDVILTAANDVTVGEVVAGFTPEQSIAFGGIRLQSTSATFTDNGWLETRGFNYGAYPNVTLHDATANRKAGTVYLPVTVGGTTRNQSFTVDWIAEDGSAQFGRDYKTHNSGRLTWSKSGDGTKYITIPLVTTENAGSNRTFKVRFVVARGVNVSRGEATVTIAEFAFDGLNGQPVEITTNAISSTEFAIKESIGSQPIFLNDVEQVRYSGKWQTYDKNDAAALRVTVDSDNGTKVLKECAAAETGSFELKLADYDTGFYTLKHEIVNDLGETLATMKKSFSIVDTEDVELHGGILTQSETWSADKVHVVYETVTVPAAYTLFIEPGTIVKFMTGTGIDISQGGALFANKIVFTHINDDTIGGDTLSDGYTVAPPMDAYTLSGNFTFGDDTELRGITQNNALTGTISTRKVLSRGSTYRVSGTLTIANGGSLTIPPGTVLKMESGASIVVNSGATLSAIGTRAAPIIITSIKDDSVSGDTNGDGDKTIPQPGDWNMIKCSSGMINMEHASVLYGGKAGNNGGDVFYLNGGEIVFNESVMAHAFMYGVALENGSWAMTNSVFQDFHTAFRHFAQCDCVNSVFYDMTYLSNNGGQNFKNCIIADFATALCWRTDNCIYQNCVIWNSEDFGPQDSEKTGKNGNIWGDPLFVDPDSGDFRIQEGSPCVDAADSSVAPEYDYYGQPRITVTEQGTNTVGQLADIGICEVMPRNVTSDIDLVPQNVRTVTNAVPGELLFVKWEVKNAGGNELEGAWRDTVSLVSNNGREVVLGNKTTMGVIAPGGSIFCSGYFTVPPISEGEWYPKVNVNSYRDVFEGALGINNALVGERALTVKAEALDPSVAREGVIGGGTPSVIKLTFGADDENRMVKFDVPAGVKVTWGFGFMPQGASQSGSMTATDGGVMFRVPEGATDVYVVLESDKTATYEMTTESTKMVITGVTPNTLPSSGTTTLTITGAGFGETNAVILATATDIVRLQSIAKDASGNLIATVDCSTLTAGVTYGVRVESGEKSAELDSAVTVTKAEGKGILELEYDVPSSVRPGRVFSFTVTYRNIGNKDMCVPLLTVQDSGNDAQNPIQFSLNGERFTGGGFQFVGTDADGGFGPLCPGDEVTLQLLAKIPVGNNGSTAVSVRANTESDIMAKYTTEVDRYLTPSMKAEFANTTDAELKARGEHLTNVFGVNNGEMVQNFASFAQRFYECNGFVMQRVDDLMSYGVAVEKVGESISAMNQLVSYSSLSKSNDLYVDNMTGVWILGGSANSFSGLCRKLEEQDNLNGMSVALIAHGLNNSVRDVWVHNMADALSEYYDVVLAVNWEEEADALIPINASINIDRVALKVAVQLTRCNLTSSKTTLIGHSFGSHLLGRVSRYFNGTFDRHIGLDTAETKQVPDSFEVDRKCARRTEYYRTSSVSGRNDAYADENYIVCRSRGFDFVGIVDPHSYAHEWFIDNIRSLKAKKNEVGFWSKEPPLIKGGGFLGVINGDNHQFECVYKYGEEGFKYPGNKSGWIQMYDAWKSSADLDIVNNGSVSLADNTELIIGVPQHITVKIEDNSDIRTVERIHQYRLNIVYADDSGSTTICTKTQFSKTFDCDLELPEKIFRNNGQKGMLEFNVEHSEIVFDPYSKIPHEIKGIELYDKDNINQVPVIVKKTEIPVACINGESQNDFTIEHKVPFDSYEDYVEAVEDGDTIEFEFDGSKSIGGGDKELTQFIWRDPDTDKVVGTKKTLSQTFYSTLNAWYPISLTVANENLQWDMVHGWLHIIPVDKRTGKKITQPVSYDPNEMAGPLGLGDPNTERFVKPGEWMTYTVYFENMTNATAAAQEVYVTNPLSEWLDWSTFEMGEVSFGNQIDLGLSGKSSGTTEKRMDGTNWIVRTELSIEPDTTALDSNRQQKMCAKWYLRIVDPSTDTGWPIDPVAGFLPPNNPETHCGEGHLTYRIKLRDDAPSGLVITNSATIVFDYNEPITTDPAWWNTVAPETIAAKMSPEATKANEGDNLTFKVFGGNLTKRSSVQVQLVYNTASAADIDLKNGTIAGGNRQRSTASDSGIITNLKFPLTLTWAPGEIGEKTITIPVKTDKVVEADEFFTLQLALPKNMALGDDDICTVAIHDPGYDELKAKIDGGAATAKEITQWNKLHPGKVYVRPLATPATGGKVSGGAAVVPGKTARLRASALSGYVFAGWYTNAMCAAGQELVGYGDYRNPSLAYLADELDVDIFARFIPVEEDYLTLGDDFLPSEITTNAQVSIYVPVESASLPDIKVSGLPSGLKFYAKETVVKATKTTPAYTIATNTIYGIAPKRATTGPATVTVTVKNAGKYAITRKYQLSIIEGEAGGDSAEVVSDALKFYSLAVDLSDDFAGKVTGSGVYQAGKKVTVKATANKGYVFNGWYMGEELLTQAASYSFTMPETDVALYAKFVTAEEDAASIALSVDALGGEISPEAIISVTNMCGVALKWSVAADAFSQPTVAVSGLPSGLKFTAKDIMKKGSKTEIDIPANTIYGAPTAESKLDAKTGLRKPSAVKFTVTTAGKSKRIYPVDMTILPLPDWAVGTFNGGGDLGQVSLTVAKTGKLSGKYLSDGLTWSLAANSFDSIDESGEVYRATLIGKSGKLAMTNEVGVACDSMGGFAESIDYIAYRNNWKLEPWKTIGKPFAKAAALEYEDSASVAGVPVPGVLTLKFAASGAVTVKGSFVTGVNERTGKDILYTASGSAVLAPQSEPDETGVFDAVVFVYLPPKAGKFDGYVRCINVRWTGDGWIVEKAL